VSRLERLPTEKTNVFIARGKGGIFYSIFSRSVDRQKRFLFMLPCSRGERWEHVLLLLLPYKVKRFSGSCHFFTLSCACAPAPIDGRGAHRNLRFDPPSSGLIGVYLLIGPGGRPESAGIALVLAAVFLYALHLNLMKLRALQEPETP